MKFTGERYIPTEQGQIRLEHYHRYASILKIISKKEVLDLACGEGFGSYLMSEHAAHVTGADISKDAIEHAKENYKINNISYVVCDATNLVFPSNSFDVVVSFETIEHLTEQEEMLREIRRVLRPGGILVISSPNRPVYSAGNYVNEFHKKELDFDEFESILRDVFQHVDFYGQKLVMGSVIQSLISSPKTGVILSDDGTKIIEGSPFIEDPVYFLAVCSDRKSSLSNIEMSTLYPTDHSLIKQYLAYAKWAKDLEVTLVERDAQIMEYNQKIEELSGWAKGLEETLVERDAQITEFSQKIEEMSGWAMSLDDTLVERDEQIMDYNQKIEEMSEWVKGLDDILAERDEKIVDYNQKIEELILLQKSLSELAARKDKQIQQLHSKLVERDRVLDSLNTSIAELQFRYTSSTSWRITAPLRFMNTIVARCYKSLYRRGGLLLRNIFSDQAVNIIKKLVPSPHGIPKRLSNQILPISVIPHMISDVDAATDKPDVFVFSIIDWDFRTQRPQHIARLLAENHRVFYVEMMLEMNGPSVRRISDRLFVIRLAMHSIGHIQPYQGQADKDQLRGWINSFIEFGEQVSATSFKHIIIQHPFWWQMAQHLPPEYRITFDCMDDIAGFANTTEWMLEQEQSMISECDHLVVSSEYLKEKFGAIKQPTLIRNGGDLKHFQVNLSNAEPPNFLLARSFLKQSGIVDVGYVGAIAEWFDTALIRRVANLNPNMRFHLCGAVTTKEAAQLESLSNVTLYGEIPYSEVPAFISQMDVMTIPFQLLPIIQACDPVKFYEYSAMGKPTVATCLPELKRAENLTFLSSGPQEFSSNLHKAVEMCNSTGFIEELRTYAAANTWQKRCDIFEHVLQDLPKVSVVILSYGDPVWTINTLHSLFDKGETYPNLEILLVDNGSSEDHLDQIRKAIATKPIGSVRLIENGDNLGFSRGNNVGIKQATGEYVLLLNNDTYLAPGAIAAMVKHLNDNPLIGVVCPMTNNIGNEARVDIDYADMGEMIRNSRQLMIGYRGQHSEIPVVAYFAAMFRRKDFEQFGLLSEDYGLGMFEDDDHCAVIRSKGYICALAEDAFTHHHLSATFDTMHAERKRKLFEANKKIYEAKFGEWIPHKYRTKRPLSRLA